MTVDPRPPTGPETAPPQSPDSNDPAGNPYGDPLVDHREWQRLDPMMLLVHPIREVIRFLPALVGLLIARSATGGDGWWWQVIGIGVPIALGVARYLTTRFRIADERVELRRGLFARHLLSTPLDRVRTVDITASPIHRVLGLTTVRIGTGTASSSSDDTVELDGVRAGAAAALRVALLHTTTGRDALAPTTEVPADEVRTVVSFEPGWLRFAPFTSSGVIIAAAVVGVGSQVIEGLGLWDHLSLDDAARNVARLSLALVVPLAILALLAIASVFAVAGYVVANFGFRLTYAVRDGVWHVRRGLLTTRETSMDDARLHGVVLGEPLGLRIAGGSRLTAIVTGLGPDDQQGTSGVLVPAAPRELVLAVAGQVLGDDAPLRTPLTEHGPAARRRRYTRAVILPAILTLAALVAAPFDLLPAWAVVIGVLLVGLAALLAADRARSLGHALTNRHLVSRSGTLARQHIALETQAIIGWTFSASWFQRRVGLTTLIATMAGRPQSVTVLDVPEGEAAAVARQGVPGLLEQFLAPH